MNIFLIRHTTPKNAVGLCYGFTDIDVDDNFITEATIVKSKFEAKADIVYTSPLTRCIKLAQFLFEDEKIKLEDNLKEMNFGNWENKLWDEIDYAESQYWMDDFVNATTPNGESYTDLYNRVTKIFMAHLENHNKGFTWVAHSGVIRCILSYITNTPLKASFKAFKIEYGAVIKIELLNNKFSHTIF